MEELQIPVLSPFNSPNYLDLRSCSPRNFDMAKSLGANVAVDYHDATQCSLEICAAIEGNLEATFDCVSSFQFPQIYAAVISEKDSSYVSVSPVPLPWNGAKSVCIQGSKSLGEAFKFGDMVIPADEEAFGSG